LTATRRAWLLAALLAGVAGGATGATAPRALGRASIPGATFATILPPSPQVKSATVHAFRMDRVPVSNADFAAFIAQHPRWRRDRVPRVFADEAYLLQWHGANTPERGSGQRPVTQVSWFAASAYCEAQHARLPTWYEWELVAAASEQRADARADPHWRQQILDWYARPGGDVLPDVGAGRANYYGVHDVHGLVWEWVEDLGSMMVSADNREQGDPDTRKFCGSGALSLEDKENYAMLMRVATLSSMQARYTSRTMGFRCVTDSH
jgi:sulfatase modifying factor 1